MKENTNQIYWKQNSLFSFRIIWHYFHLLFSSEYTSGVSQVCAHRDKHESMKNENLRIRPVVYLETNKV